MQKLQTQKGFTLVEMIVAVGIFAIVMVVSMGTLIVLVSASNLAQKTLATSTNLSFALDAMSRNIRTGYDYFCTNSPDSPLQPGVQDCTDNSALIFTDGETGDRTAFRLFDGAVEQKIETGEWIPLTSRDVTIEALSFTVTGTTLGPVDTEQPRVQILMSGQAPNTTLDVSPFYIQTTVMQKSIDY